VRRRKTATLSAAQGLAGIQRFGWWLAWPTGTVGGLSRKSAARCQREGANGQTKCAAKAQGREVVCFHEFTPFYWPATAWPWVNSENSMWRKYVQTYTISPQLMRHGVGDVLSIQE
jgi:hypothetical protein